MTMRISAQFPIRAEEASAGSGRWRVRRWLRLAGSVLLLACSAGLSHAGDYRLSVGDVVQFDFLDDTLVPVELPVSSSGRLSVPLIGGVDVAGLTVPEAVAAIRTTFIERQMFIDPQISLTVTSYRPVFVLGDVRAPGSFPFQPPLNVEQAVALAGGQSAGGAAAEDRVVTRARLRGNLEETAIDIAREGAGAARMMAQLAGRSELTFEDMPAKARALVTADVAEIFLANERNILEADLRSLKTRNDQLTAAIDEVNGALANLQKLAANQTEMIASARSEHDRAKTLHKRGLKTLTELANTEREAAAQESHLLEIYNQMSTTRRELGELQRALAELTDTRTRTALMTLQEHTGEIERLAAARESLAEQILLVSSLASEEARESSSLTFDYQIRREVDGQMKTYAVDLGSEVLPGDTVLVHIQAPGTADAAMLHDAAGREIMQ